MPTNSFFSRTFSGRVLLILTQVGFLFACQPLETRVVGPASPSPTVVSAIIQPTTTFTPIPPTPTSSVQVTPTVTLVPSTSPLSTPATPYPEEWLAFVGRDFKGRVNHPHISVLDTADTTIAFIRQDGSGLLQPEMFKEFYTMVESSLTWSPDGKYLLYDWSNFGPTMTRVPVIHVADPLRERFKSHVATILSMRRMLAM